MAKYRKKPMVIDAVQNKDNPSDWIIKGVAGEFYPVKDYIFQATYEPV